ncbi:hypothetical protein [Streptomyces sp. NPDC001401]|uniref:hypothetical protein n=1 Tax=Streptomyces sp. NPDC001401 TaxID=3364570 RepID=UPI00367FBA94
MTEHSLPESTCQFTLYLARCEREMTPESYELLLRILKSTNDALGHHNRWFDLPVSPRDKELFTPEFNRHLTALMRLLGPREMRMDVDLTPKPDTDLTTEQVRREIEGIARANGMEH